MLNYLKEKYHERHKLFLSLDIMFSLLTVYFALWPLISASPGQFGGQYSFTVGMVLCLGLTFAVRVVEMLVTGKRKYFGTLLAGAVIVLGIGMLELYWLVV